MTAPPVSNRAMELALKISTLMTGESMDTIREALAFSLAGFILLSGGDEDEDVSHFIVALADSMEALNEITVSRPELRGDA